MFKPNESRPRFPLVVGVLLMALMLVGGCGKKDGGDEGSASRAPQVAEQTPSYSEAVEDAPSAVEPAAPSAPAETPKTSRTEPRVPEFTVADLDGNPVRMADFSGKVVLIDFWATWCGPCRMEIPHLIDLHTQYSAQGFTVLGISVDQQGPSVVRPFVASQKIPYPVVMGDMATVQKFGDIRVVPTAFLVDREGFIVGRYEGYREKRFFEKEIEKALSGAPVS